MATFAQRIQPSVQAELAAAQAAEVTGWVATAFQHLERAHVLGQASTTLHVRVHWHMFRFALRNRMHAEAAGQLWRLVGAALVTPVGLVPWGNTGGTDVSGFARMPIPPDLEQAIAAARD